MYSVRLVVFVGTFTLSICHSEVEISTSKVTLHLRAFYSSQSLMHLSRRLAKIWRVGTSLTLYSNNVMHSVLWYPNIIDGTSQNVSTEEMKHYRAKPSVNCTSYSRVLQLIGKLSQQCRTTCRCKVTTRMHYKTVPHICQISRFSTHEEFK